MRFSLNRKASWRGWLMALLFLGLTVPLSGKEPQWIFNNGPDIADVAIGQGNLFSEVGLMTIKSTGTDMTVTVPMMDEDAFAADQYPFFALRYKIISKQEFGGLFFTTDELKNLSDDSFSSFAIQNDDQWHNLIVDMRSYSHKNWKGTIHSFRLDPINPSDADSQVCISRFGFFKSNEEAEAFLAAANDEPDLSLETTFHGLLQKCTVPGGCLKRGYRREDYLLQNKFDAAKIAQQKICPSQIVVTRKKRGKDEILPLCDTTRFGFTTYIARETGPYNLTVSEVASRLTDIAGLDSEDAIRFAVSREIMSGTDAVTFRPKQALSPEECDAVLQKLEDSGVPTESLAGRLKDSGTVSREEMAVAVTQLIKETLKTDNNSCFPPDYFTRERIRIGSWGNFNLSDFDEEYMNVYRDCGFDFLLSLAGVPSKEVLRYGNKYGIEIYLNDGGHIKPEEVAAEYIDYPSYGGHFVTDEPGSDSYDELAEICNNYAEVTGKVPYVNLLPMYANAAQLKYGAGAAAIEYYDADPDLFRKYCEGFCQKFNTNYICTDIYPLNWVDGKKVTYADYVESINIIASVAREYNREFWCYIQTFAWIPSKRTPNESEFRWQCYSMLSFGCRCILCWTYAGYHPDFPSLVDTESNKTTAWYDARPVFQELRRISDEFVKYRNVGAFTHQCTEATPYLRMTNPYTEFKTIQEIKCDDPLLIGCFEAKPGKADGTAFTVVNMTEFQDNLGTSVHLKIDGKKVTAWYRGFPEVITPGPDGYYTISLASGEGVFVTVE